MLLKAKSSQIVFFTTLFFFTILLLAAQSYVPVSKSEKIQFTSINDMPVGNFGKISEFIGIIQREKIENPISRTVDIYEFKDRKDLKVSEKLCLELVQKIFGPLDKISLKLKEKNIVASQTSGKVCVFKLKSSEPQDVTQEKHFILRIAGLKVIAFIFSYPKTSSQEEDKDAIQFIDSLNLR